MKIFTYNQYIKCIHTLRLNAILKLAEEGTPYKLEQTEKKNLYNRLIDILRDKKEAKEFINQFLVPKEKIEEESLILYTNRYKTTKYNSKEVQLLYKLKNKEVFFLIKQQTTINNSLFYQVLNDCIDVMQEYVRNKTKRNNNRIPYYYSHYYLYRKSKMEKDKKNKDKTN